MFGDYELGDFLGQGAMGTVFKCWRRSAPEKVFCPIDCFWNTAETILFDHSN